MDSTFKHPQFPKNLPRPWLISSMRNNVVHFPQVWQNIHNQTIHNRSTHTQDEKNKLPNTLSHIMDDFRGKFRTKISLKNELTAARQLRMNLESLTKENMKPKTQQHAPVEPLDLRKFSNERRNNQLLGREAPKLSQIKNEMPTGASATTLTSGLSQTLNRLVETPLQSQPQQGGETQTTTTTVQTDCAGKRVLPAQSNPPSFNQSSDNVDQQQQKKIKVKEIVPVDMDVIKERLNELTIVVDGTEFVVIGANNTRVLKKFLLELNWNNTGPAITRKLLSRIFDHKTLATHTLTGKPSPAFLNMNKPEKGQLNQLIVQDIIEFMLFMTDLRARDVKTSITTKCADECKKLRRSVSTIAVAPSEANVAIKQEPMFAVSAASNVISVPEVTPSDSYERNVIMEPEVVPSDLTEKNVITEPTVMPLDLTERNGIMEPEFMAL
ncbi:early boundary activity protein 2 isoform X1 [Bactrocera neohumeralis]|uniref:early boundary activity protein 2 isoform X1 n=1 Tax=Bactrocera neohumeralis TaxID=98809 RepID=UPI0021652618|nr:early boundary activity protein 2 isoform X1 [Bactrocera neohumeralis]XP_050321528.1 early boundary activity protein 2 isoform X1 [Bactrocera neohumeralis]